MDKPSNRDRRKFLKSTAIVGAGTAGAYFAPEMTSVASAGVLSAPVGEGKPFSVPADGGDHIIEFNPSGIGTAGGMVVQADGTNAASFDLVAIDGGSLDIVGSEHTIEPGECRAIAFPLAASYIARTTLGAGNIAGVLFAADDDEDPPIEEVVDCGKEFKLASSGALGSVKLSLTTKAKGKCSACSVRLTIQKKDMAKANVGAAVEVTVPKACATRTVAHSISAADVAAKNYLDITIKCFGSLSTCKYNYTVTYNI